MKPDKYQTYDYLQCLDCETLTIEFYHTEVVSHEQVGLIKSIGVLPLFGEKIFAPREEGIDGHHMDELLKIIHISGEEMTDEQCLNAITEYIETNVKHSI